MANMLACWPSGYYSHRSTTGLPVGVKMQKRWRQIKGFFTHSIFNVKLRAITSLCFDNLERKQLLTWYATATSVKAALGINSVFSKLHNV